jgi:hypothetical protein
MKTHEQIEALADHIRKGTISGPVPRDARPPEAMLAE